MISVLARIHRYNTILTNLNRNLGMNSHQRVYSNSAHQPDTRGQPRNQQYASNSAAGYQGGYPSGNNYGRGQSRGYSGGGGGGGSSGGGPTASDFYSTGQSNYNRGHPNINNQAPSRNNPHNRRSYGGRRGPTHQQQARPAQHQGRNAPPADSLSNYTFDDVTPQQLRTLDIYPQILDDLLQPGKGVCYLTQIITIAENQLKNVGGMKFETKPVADHWVGLMTIKFPTLRTFTCKHKNKKECKNLCSLAAIYHLRLNNSIDARLKLNIDTSVTNNFIESSRGPISLTPIPMSLKQQMMSFVTKFDECISDLIEYQIANAQKMYDKADVGGIEGKHAAILEGLEPDEGVVSMDSDEKDDYSTRPTGPIDIFTSKPFSPPDARKKLAAFSDLRKVFERKEQRYHRDDSFYEMVVAQDKLPITSLKQGIIDALQNHQCIVVAGDTGCGKSTQIPQFILEHFISKDSNSSSFANVAITQPRRISAISLAERVAVELGENTVGQTVGYNVRFDSNLPRRDLNIMAFFTTGMLLRKLQMNSELKGVSHLVVDEVHERDCTTDFLLILIKRLLTRRKDLKVIFMSASMDASLFAKYFDNCPIISVSGRCHPVSDVHLNEIWSQLRMRPTRDDCIDRAPKMNLNLLTDLIKYIDETRNQGAVLCFMPGWKEMKSLQKELEFCRSKNKLKVLLVHSKLPISEQRLIFSRTEPRERKIILATNIAETSITINDVCYVIDSGLCNSIDYDPELNMSTFGTRWISRANAKQRSGRAGRTCPGECFKLYTREEESHFQEYPFPELLRIPLESVIMEAKCHCPEEKAVSFLSQAIQHPSISAIHNALDELHMLNVLDHRENLTTLGKRISNFSTHPRLSVSLVVAAALRCLYPVLNASAVLSSTQEPFLSALVDKSQIRETKERLCNEAIGTRRDSINFMSDHIAFGNLLAQYDNAAMSKVEHEFFVQENGLNRSAISNIQECRNLYAKMMISSKFVSTYEWYSFDSLPNRNMNELELVVASLVHSFYPKVVRVVKGIMKAGRMYPNKVSPTDTQTNAKVRFASDSIVKNISLGKQLHSVVRDEAGESDEDSDFISMSDSAEDKRPNFITYLNSRVDQESGQIVVRDGSVVPPLTLILFGARDISIQDLNNKRGNNNNNNNHDNQVDQNMLQLNLDRHYLLSFKVSREDAVAIQEWRTVWHKYLNWFIYTKNTGAPVDSNDSIINGTMNEFLELNKKLYSSL